MAHSALTIELWRAKRLQPADFFHLPEDTQVFLDRITDKLKQFAGAAGEQWGRLADDQLHVISGKRDYIAGNAPDTHAMSMDDTDQQLTEWHSRVKEMGCVNWIRQVSRRQYERSGWRVLPSGIGQFGMQRRRTD